MSEIRPIETRYKGYRFRSRLEARWAVFFDALGVPWEYEAEGYDLGDGNRWLPDFVVGNTRTPFEVKPRDLPGDAFQKTAAFVEATGNPAFVLQGSPWIDDGHMLCDCEECGCHLIGCSDPLWYDPDLVDASNPNGFFVIGAPRFVLGRRGETSLWICADATDIPCSKRWLINTGFDDGERYPMWDHPALLRACSAARSARFEHGETPR